MKKVYLFLSFALLLSVFGKSQCAANFSSSIGSNGNVSFTNLSTGITTLTAFYWDFGDSQWSYAQNPSHTYGANGIYTVTLNMNDSSSCNSTYTQTLAITNVSCNLNAAFNYSVYGTYVTFYNNTGGTASTTTYTLHYGDGNSANFSSTFGGVGHQYGTSGTYTVVLTAQNSSTCISTYSAVLTLTVPPCNLNAGFTYTNTNSGYVVFNNTTTGAGSYANYTWNFGNGSGYGASQPPHFYAPGTYTVILTVTDSIPGPCSDTYSAVITVTTCIASGGFTMSKDTSITTAIVWNAYPNYPSNVSTVLWSWGDGQTSSSYYPSHTYSATGNYNICLTISVTCGADTTYCLNSLINRTNQENSQMATVNVVNTSIITGIAKNSKNTSLLVYPNPAKNELYIEGVASGATILISDLLGKTVIYQVQKENKSVIDISGLNPGIYVVRAAGETGISTTKIIKE
jgi:PKD repeat protein